MSCLLQPNDIPLAVISPCSMYNN